MVLFSRVLGGIGGTAFLTATVFVVRTSTDKERASQMALLQTVYTLGLVFGPAVNYPLSLMNRTRLFSWLQLTSYNVVGFVVAALMFVALALVHILFEEPKVDETKEKQTFSKLEDIKQFVTVRNS